jgi:hypothetical protein
MTEDEAKQKWCPMYRQPDNRGTFPIIKCIASACMMWRWEIKPGTIAQNDEGLNYSPKESGYCGLGGRP